MALTSVWVVRADETYDVLKNIGSENKELVALTTLEGRGKVTIEGCSPMTVIGSTLLVFEHNKVRRYLCDGDLWHFWWFEFTESGFLHLPLNTVMSIDRIENEKDDCTRCLELLRKPSLGTQVLASALFHHLTSKWAYHLQKETHRRNSYEEMIEQIISYMHAHLSSNLTVADMAKKAGLSERRFRQVVKNITGEQPKRFYDRLRMEVAFQLLKNTPLSIADISDRLGYSSQFHFSKVFRSFWRVPPSQCR